ncbi:c-type cytochrome [Bizionia hallyeonensis]|uniref:C-type cytochrome n=1 Tax=Bizionia hallyeonensis TaxID=1123757 RepID=A0ABW0C622_9FLAO
MCHKFQKHVTEHFEKASVRLVVLSLLVFSQLSCNQHKDDYDSAMNNQDSLVNRGQVVFQNNCGMCHKIDKQAAGVTMHSFSETMKKNDLYKFLIEGKQHPQVKISLKETEALTAFINNK